MFNTVDTLSTAGVWPAMTWEVIVVMTPMACSGRMHPSIHPNPIATLRRQRRVSQLELGLCAGVSQRYLSCIETGRARPSCSTLLGLPMPEGRANLLEWMLGEGGLRRCLINEAEVCGEVWHRALRESQQVPALARRLEGLVPQSAEWPAPAAHTPLLLTRLRSSAGDLALFSVFSSVGAPMDVTLASLRIEHLFAADAATHAALVGAGP